MKSKLVKSARFIGLGAGVLLTLAGFFMTPGFVSSHFGSDINPLVENTFILSRFQAAKSGSITTFRVYCSGSGNVKVAIYADDDQEPGNLLNAVDTAQPVVEGWNSISFPSTDMVQGVYYWLAANSDARIVSRHLGAALIKFKTAPFSTFTFPDAADSGFKRAATQKRFILAGDTATGEKLIGTGILPQEAVQAIQVLRLLVVCVGMLLIVVAANLLWRPRKHRFFDFVSRVGEKFQARRFYLPFCFASFLIALTFGLLFTQSGPGISPDSIGYIGAAKSLSQGNGFGVFNHYPLYPLLIAGFVHLGFDLEGAARLIPILCFALLMFPLFPSAKLPAVFLLAMQLASCVWCLLLCYGLLLMHGLKRLIYSFLPWQFFF